MTRKSKEQRNAEQLVRQQRVRDEARLRLRPSRDDIARMLLWKMIMSTERHRLGRRQALDRLCDEIVDGFSPEASSGESQWRPGCQLGLPGFKAGWPGLPVEDISLFGAVCRIPELLLSKAQPAKS